VAIANVAAITTDLNCSVTLQFYIYIALSIPQMLRMLHRPLESQPGYLASKMAETPPINKPSNNAYPGAK
jgi:hypothetical protein